MCWSFEVSIVSWLIGLATAFYLFTRQKSRNDVILALLITTYSTMQLAEAMMWKDVECKTGANKIGTYIAYFSLWLHPLVIALGIYWAYGSNAWPAVLVGGAMLAYGIATMPSCMACSQPKPETNGHLAWGFSPSFYFAIFGVAMAMCLMYIRPWKYGIAAVSFYAITFALTFLIAPKGSVGSYWCWMAAFLAPIVAIAT